MVRLRGRLCVNGDRRMGLPLLLAAVNVLLVRIRIRVVLPAGQVDGQMCAPLSHGRHGVAEVSWLRMCRGRSGGIVMWLRVSLQRHRDGHGLLLLLRVHGEGRRKRRLMRLLMLRHRLLLRLLIALLMRLRQWAQHRLRKGQRLRQARVPRARLTGRRRDGARSSGSLTGSVWAGCGRGWQTGGGGGRRRRRGQVHAGHLQMASDARAGARLGWQHGRSAAAEQSAVQSKQAMSSDVAEQSLRAKGH